MAEKKTYEKPAYHREEIFEKMSLACVRSGQPPCKTDPTHVPGNVGCNPGLGNVYS